jgi:type II secretory pathway pseudopilin PulG
MDTLLTLIIAFGVIATGICAILAASADRRQGQVTERQAQLAEQSLAEHVQSLREQNERAW